LTDTPFVPSNKDIQLKVLKYNLQLFVFVIQSLILTIGAATAQDREDALFVLYPELTFVACSHADGVAEDECPRMQADLLSAFERLRALKNFRTLKTASDGIGESSGERKEIAPENYNEYFASEMPDLERCLRSTCANVFENQRLAKMLLADRFLAAVTFYRCVIGHDMRMRREGKYFIRDPYVVYFDYFERRDSHHKKNCAVSSHPDHV
jgi:hypothetical protein